MLEVLPNSGSRVPVIRQDLRLQPDPTRVVTMPLNFGNEVLAERVTRSLRLPDADAGRALHELMVRFGRRHRDIPTVLRHRWDELAERLGLDSSAVHEHRQLLAAAYVTMEYSIEAAALCNPSIVVAPDQSGAGPDEVRVVLSLRAIGEGHRSSIEFRSGTVDSDGHLRLDRAGRWATHGRISGADATGGYVVEFDPHVPLSERVLCAATDDESLGLEDARFVTLQMPDGATSWAATYTACNGRQIAMKLIRTDDFTSYSITPLTGPGASDKGVALFPRPIDGQWWAVGRQDGQRLFLMTSPDLLHWSTPARLADPVYDWELVQMGNCGSPIETDAGWLVITHGVGTFRRYVLGAILLDRDDPAVVLGRLPQPLIEPDDDEREGYVPNVLYSCGGLTHAGRLILPYAYSDRACTVASFDLNDIISAMR